MKIPTRQPQTSAALAAQHWKMMALRTQKSESANLSGRTESSAAVPSRGSSTQVQAQGDGDGDGDPTDERDEENEEESIEKPPGAAEIGSVGNETLTVVYPPARTCIACFEHIDPLEAARTPCNHNYC